MKKIFILCVCATLVISAFGNIASYAEENIKTVFVSTDGDDELGNGSIEKPFKTPEKARDYVRSISSEERSGLNGITVYIRGGTYKFDKSFGLYAEDSGSENCPVTYRSYLNEKVVFSGGKDIDFSKASSVTEKKVLNKLPDSAKGKVVAIDYSNMNFDEGNIAYAGVMGWGSTTFSDLVCNGRTMQLARYPDDGKLLYVEKLVSEGSREQDQGQSWECTDDIMKSIQGEEDLWIYDWIFNGYAGALSPVNVPNAYTVEFKKYMWSNGGTIPQTERPFYFVNSLSFLSVPGEYYIDRENDIIYFYPPEEGIKSLSFTALAENLLIVSDANYINIKGIEFAETARGAVGISNSTHIVMDGCVIRNTGFGAMGISAPKIKGPVYCEFKNGKIYDCGNMGISLSNLGDLETLSPSEVRIFNNEFENLGLRLPYQSPAVMAHPTIGNGVVGVYFGYNKVHNLTYGAVLLSDESVVEHNDIYNVLKYGEDEGALYYGGRYAQRGRTINYNYIHDIEPATEYPRPMHGANGIYLDGATGVKVTNNVLENISDRLYFSSSSGLHEVYNNVFIGNSDKGTKQQFSAEVGGLTYLTSEQIKSEIPEYMYTSEIWTSKYPEVKAYLEKEYPCVSAHKIKNNIFYKLDPLDIDPEVYDDEFTEISDNWEGRTDPGFVDEKNGNFQLKENAPVLKELKNFEIINMNKIGRVSDNAQRILKNSLVLRINSPIAAKGTEAILVDNNDSAVVPSIIDSRTLMPVRFISENFDSEVKWDADSRVVTIASRNKTIKMKIDEKIITVDGEEKEMDVPAQIVNSRTFIPLRALAEALGKEVFWDERGLVIIGDKDNIPNKEDDENEINYLLDLTNNY